jgi:hypothetical protein
MLKNLFAEEGDVDILEEIAIGVEKGDSNSVHALTEKALTQKRKNFKTISGICISNASHYIK